MRMSGDLDKQNDLSIFSRSGLDFLGCDVFCSLINLKCDAGCKALAKPQRTENEKRLERIVIIITKGYIGCEDGLGETLLMEFLSSLEDCKSLPQQIIFMHRAATLCCDFSPLVRVLKSLQKRGTSIKVCEKSAQSLQIIGDIRVGSLVSMPAIADICLKSEKVVWI